MESDNKLEEFADNLLKQFMDKDLLEQPLKDA